MDRFKTLLEAGLAGSLLAFPLLGMARVDIDVDLAPPPVVVEDVPLHEGYIYAPGYWDWDDAGHHYVWKHGEYMENHPGDRWVNHAWVQREGRYHFNPGHWEHGS